MKLDATDTWHQSARGLVMGLVKLMGSAGLTACLAGLPLDSFAQSIYRITDLGDLPGGSNYSFAYAINAQGQVAGYGNVASGEHAFLWDRNIGMLDLGALSDQPGRSIGYGLNNGSTVVGQSLVVANQHAFRRVPGMSMEDLQTFTGPVGTSQAQGINNSGVIVGTSLTALGDRAFVATAPGNMQMIGTLQGSNFNYSYAYGINDAGEVVGRSRLGTVEHAFRWTAASGMVDLGDLPAGADSSVAYAIGANGQIVGESGAATGTRAFLYRPGAAGLIDLGDLPGGVDQSRAFAVNSAGLVVGGSNVAPDLLAISSHAFIWSVSRSMQDLNDLVDPTDPLRSSTVLVEARGINDSGQIVGLASIGGQLHGFLLTPIPEPETLSLFVFGLVAIQLTAGFRRGSAALGK